MSSVTKREMVEILNEIAEAIETNRSEGVRHMAWRLEQEIERDDTMNDALTGKEDK